MPATMTKSDVAAYAGFWSWFEPSREAHSEAYRALGYDNVCAIDKEVRALKLIKEIAAAEIAPEIKAYMLEGVRQRGAQRPERLDYTAFFKRALENTRSGFGTKLKPYQPETGAAGVKLLPTKAVRVSSTQESYSDDSAVAVPFVIEPGKPADLAVFIRNVAELVRRADTHSGMAGSGCNYSASLHNNFVLVHCRASISD